MKISKENCSEAAYSVERSWSYGEGIGLKRCENMCIDLMDESWD